MVSRLRLPSDGGDSRRDRGQLILIGSVAVAFIVLGMVVVANAAITTETVSRGELDEQHTAATFDREVERNTRSLLLYVNHGSVYSTDASLRDSAAANYTTYGDLLAESYGTTRPAAVNLTYHGANATGTRVVQRDDAAFDDAPMSSKRSVGWFVLNLNTSSFEGDDDLTVVVTDANDDEARLHIQKNRSNGQTVDALDVRADLPGTANDTSKQQCIAADDRVLLDVLDGRSLGGSCTFNATQALDGPYEISFEDGDDVRGTYSIVHDGGPSSNPTCEATRVTKVNPCSSLAVWKADVSASYVSDNVQYRTRQNVTIYDTAR